MQAPHDANAAAAARTPSRGLAAAIALAGALVGTFASIVRGKVTAHVLGPVGVGVSAEVLQIVATAMVPLAMLGGPALVQRVSPSFKRGDHDDVALAYASASTGMAAVTLVATLGATLAARAVFPAPWGAEAWPLVLPAGLATGLLAVALLPSQTLVAMGEIATATRLQVLNALVQMALVCAATWRFGLTGQFVAMLLSALVLMPLGQRLGRRAVPTLSWRFSLRFDPKYGRDALTLGLASMVAGFSAQGAMSVVRLSLEHRGGPALNGQFQAAWAIGSTYFALMLGSLGSYAFPRFAAATDAASLGREVDETARFVLGVVPPAVLLLVGTRDLAVWLLYSSRFGEAAPLLGMLSVADASRAMVWVLLGPLLYRQRLGHFVLSEVYANGVFALAAWLLVPRVGLMGVGWAYAFMQVTTLMIAPFLLRQACEVRVSWRVVAAALGASTMAFAGQWATLRWPASRALVLAVAGLWAWRAGLVTAAWAKLRARLGR